MQRKLYFISTILPIVFVFVLLSGCGADIPASLTEPEEMTEPVTTIEPEPKFISLLTGLETESDTSLNHPVAIMINNYHKALPQHGISKAGIIYECAAEGMITRLLAVFDDYKEIPMIGPVRSSRDYYIDLAFNHGAYYIHYGGSPMAYQKIKDQKVQNLDGLSALDTIMFWRDKARLKLGSSMYEHSVFTSGEKILEGLEFKKYNELLDEPGEAAFKFARKEYTPNGTRANEITVPYGKYVNPKYVYDVDQGLYLREQFENPHIDGETGEQLSFKNVIVLYCRQGLISGDTEGRLWMEITGSGDGVYITNGMAVPITYKKPEMKGEVTYYTEDGNELSVNPGKTIVNVLDKTKEIKIEE